MNPEPFRPLRLWLDLQREIDDAFAEVIDKPWGRPASRWPPIDLYETADEYLLVADVPGLTAEDIELRVTGREVSLCGERSVERHVATERGVVVERTYGRFCRTVTLQHAVDAERIEARYENGVYRARLPKSPTQETERSNTPRENQ